MDCVEARASDRFNLLSQNFYELATLTAATGRNIVIALPYTKRVTSGMTRLRTTWSWICSSRLDRNLTRSTWRFWRELLTLRSPWSKKITEFDSDEGLEAILRRELIEIACFNGVSDPETLRDLVVTNLSPVRPEA